MGRDDNKSTGLTGSNGALTVWGEMKKGLQPEPLQPVMPEDIELVAIDPPAGASPEEACRTSALLPFIKGSAPAGAYVCDPSDRPLPGAQDAPAQETPTPRSWFRRLFD